jgi:peptide alpha-N-acetyltransferase
VCLKGFILYDSGKKDEGREMCNKGLKMNMQSFFAWDLMAQLHEKDENMPEAIKCMRMAIVSEKGKKTDRVKDMQVKLSMAQFTSGDYVGFLETRTAILNSAPEEARSWAPCAIAAQFMKDYPTALAMMDQYTSSVRADLPPHELSGLLFYKLELLIESGDLAQALEFMAKEEYHLVEKRRWREIKIALLLRLDRAKEAEPLVLELLDINSEDSVYWTQLAQARGIEGNVDKMWEMYQELRKRYPRSMAAKRGPLEFLPAADARFKSTFAEYYQPLLEKGAPSCFGSLKSLYADPQKVAVIESQLFADLKSLREKSCFDGDSEKANPTSLLWGLYFAAQHQNKLHKWTEALQLIDEAIAHTPTLIDLYIIKARIAKHMGDLETAYALTDRARELDTADRWLNSTCVRYALAADKIEEADLRLGFFARAEDGQNNVFDMQNQRYILALGAAYLRVGKVSHGLKILTHMVTVYKQLVEDHYELIRFSMNAGTVSAWSKLGAYLSTARSNTNYVAALSLVVQAYLTLYIKSNKAEQPKQKTEEELEKEWAAMSPKTRKQAKQNHRRAVAAALENEEKKEKKTVARSLLFLKGDTDPIGEDLVARDPLPEAYRLVKSLVKGAPQSLAVQVLAGIVAVYRGKFVQALTHLSKAKALAGNDGNHPRVKYLAALILQAPNQPENAQVKAAIDASRDELLNKCKTSAEFLAAWKAETVGDVAAQVEFQARALKKEVEFDFGTCVVKPKDIQECLAVLRLLEEVAPKLVDAWKSHCKAVFSSAQAFGGSPVSAPELMFGKEEKTEAAVAAEASSGESTEKN